MALREVTGWAVFFAAFQKLKEVGHNNSYWTDDKERQALREFCWTFNAGGTAGLIAWTV